MEKFDWKQWIIPPLTKKRSVKGHQVLHHEFKAFQGFLQRTGDKAPLFSF